MVLVLCRLWLARRMLEEGFKVDDSYWPLAQTLCEVLFEIGDVDEYARIASHVRRHDPQCPSILLLDAKLAAAKAGDGGRSSSWSHRDNTSTTNDDAEAQTKKKTKKMKKNLAPESRELKLAKRASAELAHLEVISQDAAKKRRVLYDDAQAALQQQSQPVEYLLERTSWQSLGQLLLQVYDELSTGGVQSAVVLANVQITVVDFEETAESENKTVGVATPSIDGAKATAEEEQPQLEAATSTSLAKEQGPSLPETTTERAGGRQSKRKKRGLSVSEPPTVSSAAPSDNDTQDSGLAASEVDEPQPARRKSRRHEERLRGEYAAAAKRALEKDLGYRLQEFLPEEWGSQLADTTKRLPEKQVDWLEHLVLKLVGTKFQIYSGSGVSGAPLQEFDLLAVPGNDAVGREHVSIGSHPNGAETNDSNREESSSSEHKQDAAEISKQQIAEFVSRASSQKTGAVQLLTKYLNQCGEWAHKKLVAVGDDDDGEIHSICFWAEKLIREDPEGRALQHERSVAMVAGVARQSGLTSRAKLFLLELKFDRLIRQTGLGKHRRKQLQQLSMLIASVDGLLLELCWADDSEHSESGGVNNDLVRLFWLLARMHERCGRSSVAKEYYVKCQETMMLALGCQGESLSEIAPARDQVTRLPNQKVDAEISLAILNERISGLQSTDVCSEARRRFAAANFDETVTLLLEHFFPDKHPPRIVDLLREFEPTESVSTNDERMLIDLLLESFAKSSTYQHDDVHLFLATLLFHVTTFIDNFGSSSEVSGGALHPEHILESGLRAAKFALTQLEANASASDASDKYQPLLQACCLKCLKPSILLLFDSPKDVFRSVCTVLVAMGKTTEAATGSSPSGEHAKVVEAVARTFHTIRSFDEAAFRKLFAKLPTPVTKKKQSRRDRVRGLLVDLLRFLNRDLRYNSLSGNRPISAHKRGVLMLHCRTLMKEEEDIISRREDKTARQLFGNAAILFLLLSSASLGESAERDCKPLADLVALLHSRMGQYGICGLSYLGEAGDTVGEATEASCFLETSIYVLSQFMDANCRGASACSGKDEAEVESWNADAGTIEGDSVLNRELAQCYHCMYDVQLLPGCEDHKIGNTFALLQRDSATKRPNALRLAQFAVPILLARPPKNNGQKKENLKLLGAIREALKETNSMEHAQSRCCPRELQSFLSPSTLLEWEEDRFPLTVDSNAAKKESAAVDAPLDHLWYLLGENFILTRVRRRGNASELMELESRVKERVAFLMTDVLFFRPKRVKSWIRLGKTMKELYHATSDACAVVLGRKRKIAALHKFAECGGARDASGQRRFAFAEIVLGTRLFEHMKRWEEKETADRDEYRITIRVAQTATTDGDASAASVQALSMEEYTIQYIVQVIEFARRCFDMAAHLAEVSLQQQQLRAREGNDGAGKEIEKSDAHNAHDELRTTVIESNEESGLLLYNVLQEFSVLNEAHERPFPDATYLRVARKALSYFHKGLSMCNGMEEADEVRFRLNFMCGKTMKKQLRCEQRRRTASEPVVSVGEQVTPRAIIGCFARAEKAHEDGEMEDALVHAFYALQAMRMEVVLQQQVSVADLRLVCEHYFEEEVEGEGDEEEGEDGGSENVDSCDTGDESTGSRSAIDSGKKRAKKTTTDEGPFKMTKDDAFRLLERAEATRGDDSALAFHSARGWLYLNVVDALESVPNEDRYFHPSRYVLAQAVYRARDFVHPAFDTSTDPQTRALAQALSERTRPLDDSHETVAAARALRELLPLFDRKRPQIVAIWLSEHIPTAKKFEELNQRQMKYDRYRLKYWRLYMQLLEESGAYGRLKEVGTWVLACKEEHDVIDEMLGMVLQARGSVLRARLGAFRAEDQSNAESLHGAGQKQLGGGGDDTQQHNVHTAAQQSIGLTKLLAKTYSYYMDVVDSHQRFASALSDYQEVLKSGELMIAYLFAVGVVAFPDEFPVANGSFGLVVSAQVATESIRRFLLEREVSATRTIADLDAQWKPLLDAARALCEDKWPERSGKGKLAKSRQRAKAPVLPAAAAATTVAAAAAAAAAAVATATAAGAANLTIGTTGVGSPREVDPETSLG